MAASGQPQELVVPDHLHVEGQQYAFDSLTHAREELADKMNKWRENIKKQTNVPGLKAPLLEGIDDLSKVMNYAVMGLQKLNHQDYEMAHKIKTMDATIETQKEGLNVTQTLANTSSEQLTTLIDDQKAHRAETKQGFRSMSYKVDRAINEHQRRELKESENVLIIRGVKRVIAGTRKETPTEVEGALDLALETIDCKRLRYVSVRRMQMSRVGELNGSPASLRVELVGTADKFNLFNAIEKFNAKYNGKLPFSVTHEIPRYAISSYKYCQQVAAIAREHNGALKTRVMIPRGSNWPVIFIRDAATREYKPMTKEDFKKAKEINVKRNRDKAAARKAARARAQGGQPENMDL